MVAEFIPGIDLCRAFYGEAVRPILDREFAGLVHSSALIGTGSEVLGFDTERSTDHHWGPRAQLFLRPADVDRFADAISEAMTQRLPRAFRGYSTHWTPPDPDDNGTQLLAPAADGPLRHRVVVESLAAFLHRVLGFDPRAGISLTDWLVTPAQQLLAVVSGTVYHDGLGELEPVQRALTWYPHDLWLYLIASGWSRIAEEEAFAGRCAEAGDELGSRVVAARLARDVMRLCFLLERRYAPYSKWLGTAFARLPCAGEIAPSLEAALAAPAFPERERHLVAALERLAERHNRLGVSTWVDPASRMFFSRPFRVIGGGRFVTATRAAIRDPEVLALPANLGSIDQWADSTPLLAYPVVFRRAGAMYGRS